MTDLPKHLGGHSYFTHVDVGALECLIRIFHPKTAVDVGSGMGDMLLEMEKRRIRCFGIDGDWTVFPPPPVTNVIHDYNTGPLDIGGLVDGTVDLGWTVEFLEHIHPKYIDNVFATLRSCDVVFCTHALPSEQPSQYHVNEQPEEYWIGEFAKRGFVLDADSTVEVRAASTMMRDFARETGKVFRNKNLAQDKPASG